jgi:methionyl-tRNA formyltransferase
MIHKKDLRIVFLGTPDFAVASLQALLAAGYNVVAVVTAPDKPAGRGMKLTQSAVKTFAVENNLPVLQPVKLKDPQFIETLQQYKAHLQVVVAFRMLPQEVWNMPPMGTINVHGSLLPQYRGAAPINWAIINGEKETGITTFKLQHAIDTGNILLQATLPIPINSTAGEIHDEMKVLGANLLVKTIDELCANTLQEKPQPHLPHLKHAPKIFTEHCKINFNQTAEEVHNLIRGLSPFPGAFTILNNKIIKIYKSTFSLQNHAYTPGTFIIQQKKLWVAANNGLVEILELQPEGKKRMTAHSFLQGNTIEQAIYL